MESNAWTLGSRTRKLLYRVVKLMHSWYVLGGGWFSNTSKTEIVVEKSSTQGLAFDSLPCMLLNLFLKMKSRLTKICLALWILLTTAVFIALVVDLLLGGGLGLVYVRRQQRMDAAVVEVSRGGSVAQAASVEKSLDLHLRLSARDEQRLALFVVRLKSQREDEALSTAKTEDMAGVQMDEQHYSQPQSQDQPLQSKTEIHSQAQPSAQNFNKLNSDNSKLALKQEDVFATALSAWRWSDSVELQRAVIGVARENVRSTEEAERLDWMLQTLDNPEEQWRECERLARGNGLEKVIAQRRVAILELNPLVMEARDMQQGGSRAGIGIKTEAELGAKEEKKSVITASGKTLRFSVTDYPQMIDLDVFRALAEEGKVDNGQADRQQGNQRQSIVLDARVEKLYKLGHVPGALNVSREKLAEDYAKVKAILEADKDKPVAIYCNGLDCEDSKMVAEALIKLGYRRVLIFQGGWQEWLFQHLPQEVVR
jgi:rhodanese-related sulfurtransferase